MIVALFAAVPGRALDFGPISVESASSFGKPERGYYFANRFVIVNRSSSAHEVRIRVESSFSRGSSDSATRSVQVGPRAQVRLEVPFLVTGYFTPDRARVSIDGGEQSDFVRVNQSSAWEESANPNVLLSRSARSDSSTQVDFFPVDVGPQEWSASWLQYTRYAAIVITPSDWMELSPSVHEAILRWAFAGGALLFTQPPGEGAPRDADPYGMGSIASMNLGTGEAVADQPVLFYVRARPAGYGNLFVNAAESLPLLEDSAIPVRGLFGVLLIFAIAGGPVNFYFLAKKNRRMWVFATIPVLAIVTSALLVGATLATEGLVRIQRSQGITYLDEPSGRAVTLGFAGFYATTSPRGSVRFNADTELRAALDPEIGDADTIWDDGQRLFGSWVGTRVPTYFAIRKSEIRRERLPLRKQGAQLTGVNGLGATIERLTVADSSRVVYEAKDIAPGQAFALTRVPPLAGTPTYEVHRMVPGDFWVQVMSGAEGDPVALLRGGDYVAVLRESPFLETALERPTRATRRGVVYGVIGGVIGGVVGGANEGVDGGVMGSVLEKIEGAANAR